MKKQYRYTSSAADRKRFSLPVPYEYKEIRGYGVIGNGRTAALIGYDGSIDWCCLPRFDSRSIFAAILDSLSGGRWLLTPEGNAESCQQYVRNTNVLVTKFYTDGSEVHLIDFMPCTSDGFFSSIPEIHRVLICRKGSMKFNLSLNPRFYYGRLSPKIERYEKGFSLSSPTEELVFSSSVDSFNLSDGVISSSFDIQEGERKFFVLSYGESMPRDISEYMSEALLQRTLSFWRNYAASLKFEGRWKGHVIRSALLLKLLVYAPTGAMVASPTASLPESIGGERNWDYRYSWIRDSSFSLWAFHLLGSQSEAEKYLHWLIDNNPTLDRDLRLMYSITGDKEMNERLLHHLRGYMNSRPVRVGNFAYKQFQLDAHGCILDALYFSSKHGAGVSDEMYYRFVRPLAYYICNNWRRKGNGIWEFRNMKEHFVYTKAWCYVGLDRACRIAQIKGKTEDLPVWQREMVRIREEVMQKGWNEKAKSFTMFYGSDYVDASLLMLPLIGFIDAKDPRMQSTVKAIRNKLSKEGLLTRYNVPDGLRGKEGSFIICNFWLVACLARMDRITEAVELFERLLSLSNHLGLYAEEVDPNTGEFLGNFPQAFSHMGLIMAAAELNKMRSDQD